MLFHKTGPWSSLYNGRIPYSTSVAGKNSICGCPFLDPGEPDFGAQPIRWMWAQESSIVAAGLCPAIWWRPLTHGIIFVALVRVLAYRRGSYEVSLKGSSDCIYPIRQDVFSFVDRFLVGGVLRFSFQSIGCTNKENLYLGSGWKTKWSSLFGTVTSFECC